MFRIKICGLTEPDAVAAAVEAGADALGFNFYAGSRRYLDPSRVAEVVSTAPNGVKRVGVFVNASTDEIKTLAEQHSLDFVQLHGDEPPEQVAELRCFNVIKVFRPGGNVRTIVEYLAECAKLDALPRAVMIDAAAPGQYGGSGATADSSAIEALRQAGVAVPLILAGGLSADNVAQAIRAALPQAVDVASGVEGPDGRKDPARMAAFVAAARTAFGK